VHLLSQATKEGPLLQQGLSAIRRALKEGARLVDELSDMALLRAGRLRLRLDPVDLLPLVDMALEAPRSSAEQKGVKLVLVRQVSSLPVMGDPDRLQQIVLQLLRNAVSVTPAGGRVEVAVGRDGTSFWLAVSDTGRGIAPELLPRIFDRPLPRDLVAPRAQASLGVGLAIVKHLVELHGGKVEVSSPGLGKGACFLVRLPVPALLPPGFPFVGTSSPLLVEQRRVPSPPATLARVE
jgi:signal transduction histidine kinase